MKSSSAYQQTDSRVQACLADPQQHTVCTHMWEQQSYPHLSERANAAIQDKELRGVMGVICGVEGALYDDTHYSQGPPFTYRHQRHDPDHGMIGLSLSAMHPRKAIPPYFVGTQTGLLLVDPELVFVSAFDASSLYFDSPTPPATMDEGNDPQSGYVHVFNTARSHFVNYQRGEKDRELCRELIRIQFPDWDEKHEPEYINVDPKCAMQHQRAKAAMQHLMKHYDADEQKDFTYNEAPANIRPEHVAGIVVKGKGLAEKLGEHLHADGSVNWRAFLSKDGKTNKETLMLAREMAVALKQVDLVQRYFRDYQAGHPDKPLMAPSIFICDETADRKLLHFPPTRENRKLVAETLKQQEQAYRD